VGVYLLCLAEDEDKGDGSFEDVCEPTSEIKCGELFVTRWVTVSF